MNRKFKKGMGLPEIVIVIGILATTLVFIIEIFISGIRSTGKSLDTQTAAGLANECIETVKSAKAAYWTNPGEQPLPAPLARINNVAYYGRLNCENVKQVTTDVGIIKVSVKIWWFGGEPTSASGTEFRTGYGKREIKVTSYLYKEK